MIARRVRARLLDALLRATMRDAAISSIAFVIRFVDCTDLIRRRTTRSFAPTCLPYPSTAERHGAPWLPRPPARPSARVLAVRRRVRMVSCSSSVSSSAAASFGAAGRSEGANVVLELLDRRAERRLDLLGQVARVRDGLPDLRVRGSMNSRKPVSNRFASATGRSSR